MVKVGHIIALLCFGSIAVLPWPWMWVHGYSQASIVQSMLFWCVYGALAVFTAGLLDDIKAWVNGEYRRDK